MIRSRLPGPPAPVRGLVRTALLLVASCAFSGSVQALEIAFEGKTYRSVEVISVTGDAVLLGTNDGEITVSRKGLTWQLEAAVKEFQKKSTEEEVSAEEALLSTQSQRAWLYGPVRTQTGGGVTVMSSRFFLPATASRSGKVKESKEEKNGAPILTGQVFVRGLRLQVKSHFDRVLWRDGFAEVEGRLMPAFTVTDPGPVAVPDVTGERVWTNAENKEMTAVLESVEGGKGVFVRPGGKKFTYDIQNLSPADQGFIRDALLAHAKVLEQLRRDHPGQKLDRAAQTWPQVTG
jgi:hypothetical protein